MALKTMMKRNYRHCGFVKMEVIGRLSKLRMGFTAGSLSTALSLRTYNAFVMEWNQNYERKTH